MKIIVNFGCFRLLLIGVLNSNLPQTAFSNLLHFYTIFFFLLFKDIMRKSGSFLGFQKHTNSRSVAHANGGTKEASRTARGNNLKETPIKIIVQNMKILT